MRVVKNIFKIQPLQNDTVELVPNSAVPGFIGAVANTVGAEVAANVTLTRNALPLADGKWEIVVVNGAGGTYKVVNADTGFESAVLTSGATVQSGIISGVDIVVAAFTTFTNGNKCAFEITGDQTYVIPGTVLGKIASGVNLGKWRPVMPTDTIATDFTQFRIASSFQETDKNKTVLPTGYESNLSDVYIIDVVVYGMIIEAVCNNINLTADLKAKMPFYAWL